MATATQQAHYPNLTTPTPVSAHRPSALTNPTGQHLPRPTPSPAPSMRSVRIISPAPSARSQPRSSVSSLAPSPMPRSPPSPTTRPCAGSCCVGAPSPGLPSARASPFPRTRTPSSPEQQYEMLERKSAEVTRSLLEAIDDLDEKDMIIAKLHHRIGDLTQKLVDLRRDNVQIVKAAAPFTTGQASDKERIRELEIENEVLRRRIEQMTVVRSSI